MEQKKEVTKNEHHILYALSVHLKYGEVLHVESVDKETKDAYLNLAKTSGETMLLETKTEVRHLKSDDIAKVSIVAYDENYLKVWHPLKRIFFSESSFARYLFSFIVKLFVFTCVVLGIAQLGLKVIDGTIMEALFDPMQFKNMMIALTSQIGTLFKFTMIFMVLWHFLDMALSFRKTYYINQDGAPWVEHTVSSHMSITILLFVGYMVIVTALKGVMQML